MVEILVHVFEAALNPFFRWCGVGISEESARKAAVDFQARLRNPKLQELKNKWGFLPGGFEKFHRDQDLVLMRNIELVSADGAVTRRVSSFFPADLLTIRDFPTKNRGFPIAQAEFGKWYLLTLDPKKQRVVLFNSLFPDSSLEPVAESFEEFVQMRVKEPPKE